MSNVSHSIQHDEKAPDTAVLATPAAHMRHHGGCDTTEDNRRLKRRWGFDQNEPGLLPPFLRTGVIQARKKGCQGGCETVQSKVWYLFPAGLVATLSCCYTRLYQVIPIASRYEPNDRH